MGLVELGVVMRFKECQLLPASQLNKNKQEIKGMFGESSSTQQLNASFNNVKSEMHDPTCNHCL